MTARSIVPMLVLAVVLAGCLAAVPCVADDSSGVTDADAVYDSILKRMGKDGTAGASLELNDEKAMDLIRTVALSLPDDAIGSIGFLKYVRTAESPTFGGFMENANESFKSVDIDAAGGLYILVTSKSSDGGFEYDIKVHGEIDAEGVGVLEAVDPKNPSKDLTDRIGVKGTIDARVLLKTDRDLVPQQVTVNSDVGISLTDEYNFSVEYVSTDDGSKAVYTLTAATSSEQNLGIESHIHASADRLTKEDVKGLLSPSGKNVKDIVLSYSIIFRNGDLTSLTGLEIAAPVDLNSLVGNVSGDVDFDDIRDQEIPSNSEEIYFLMQRILAESGLYVSEQNYRAVVSALKDVKNSLRSGDLEYFYDTANGKYNSSAGLAQSIGDKVKNCPGADAVRASSGECGLEYTKDYRDRYVRVIDFKGDSIIPDSLFGYKVLKDEPEDEPRVNIWFDSENRECVYLNYLNENTFTARIWGEMHTDGFKTVVGDGSHADLDKLVTVKALESANKIAWYLQVTVSDTYRFIGESLKISCGDQSWTLEFEPPYGGGLFIDDGLIYILNGSYARIAGATSEVGRTIDVPSKLQYEGKEYEIRNIELGGLTFDRISVTVGTYIRLPNCSVGEIVFEEEDVRYYTNISFIDEMASLGKLSFKGDYFSTTGKVTKEGWTGPGQTIVCNGIDYNLQYVNGKLVAYAEIRGSSGDISVLPTIAVNGNDTEVRSVTIWKSSISRLDIGAIYNLYLNDTVIQELIVENSPWISTGYNSEIREIVFDNSDTIYVQCNYLTKIYGLERIMVRGPIVWDGDIESIEGKLADIITIDGIRYLKDNSSKSMVFLDIDGDTGTSITIHGKINFNGQIFDVKPFDLDRIRSIRIVHIESFPSGGTDFISSSVKELYFDNTEKLDIPKSAFSSCDQLTKVVFNGPIGVIGDNAFFSSTEIETVEFNNTIDAIGYYAFPAIGGIKTLVFEKDVGTIRENAFGGMNDLESVHFKGNVGIIGFNAFRECPSLKYLKIEGNVDELNGSSECNSFTELHVGGDVGTIPAGAFRHGPYSTDGSTKKQEFSIVLGDRSKISSVEGFAFEDMYLSQKTIESILDRSTYVSVAAFDNVITGYDEKGRIPYNGISSTDNLYVTTGDSDIGYSCSLYIEDDKASINIIVLFPTSDDAPHRVTIPTELELDGKKYPVTSIVNHSTITSYYEIDELIIGKDVKHIGDQLSWTLPYLKKIDVSSNNRFETALFGSGTDSLQMLYRNASDGSKDFICSIGSTKADTFTVPSGFEEFDLSWLSGSEIKNLVIGDGVRAVHLYFDSITGIETIAFGKDVETISGIPPETIRKFIVSTDNHRFLVHDDALYEIDADSKTASLLAYPPAKNGEAEIHRTVEDHEVVDIDDSAFWYSKLSKVTLPDSISEILLSCFDRSDIAEVVVSDSISQVFGQYHPYDRNGNYSIRLENIHSKDGRTLYTEDGAVYFKKSDGTLKLADYLGDKKILIVKEGTTDANLYYLGAKGLTTIILPQELRWLHADYNFRNSSDSRTIHILMPKDAYQDSNFDGIHFMIRTYSTSEGYDISFVTGDSGLTVSAKANDYARISDVRMGTYKVASSAIPWDALFPAPTSEMSKNYVYPDSIEVSYTVNEYRVTFITDSVDSIPEQKVAHGNTVDVPRAPMKVNMRFIGWYTNKDCSSSYDFQKPVTSDLTLYAGWTSLESQVTVYTCDGMDYALLGDYGFSNGQTRWIPYGTYTLTYGPDYGYTGDLIVEINGKTAGTAITISEENVEIRITGLEKERYSVKFINNVSRGTTDTTPRSVEFGGTVPLPEVTANDGYEFVGWTDGLVIIGQGYRFTGDTVLSAAYVRTATNDYYQDEYTITLNVPSNGTLATANILKGDKGDTITLPSVVPASGYRFNGWTVDGRTVTGGYMVLGDATLTASITKISDTPPTPSKPNEPKEDVKENEDGSTTVTVRNDDGSTTSTTTKKETDGSTTVKEETVDKDGNKTGTSTTTTNADGSSVKKEEVLDKDGNATTTTTTTTDKDGSSTKLEESKTENGSSMKEEKFDKNGNSQGSTTKVTETVTTDSGSTLETETVTTADGSGRTMDEMTTVKAESENGKVRTEATVEKRNDGTIGSSATTTVKAESENGKVEVSHEDVEAALKQMDEVVAASGDVEKKIIEIGASVKSDETEVAITSESLKSISDSGAEVRIAGDFGTITMGSDVSKNLADKSVAGAEPVSVSIGKANKAAMSSVQQDVVGDSVVLQLRASAGGESIHQLGGTVTVTVPYTLAPGEDPDLIRVYYVDDDGKLHMKISSYDPVTGTVSFETDHFSFYMIGQAVEESSDEEKEDSTVAIVVGLASIAIIAVVAAVFLIRRKH